MITIGNLQIEGYRKTLAFAKPCNPTFCASALFSEFLIVYDSTFSLEFISQSCVMQGSIVNKSFKMHFVQYMVGYNALVMFKLFCFNLKINMKVPR